MTPFKAPTLHPTSLVMFSLMPRLAGPQRDRPGLLGRFYRQGRASGLGFRVKGLRLKI